MQFTSSALLALAAAVSAAPVVQRADNGAFTLISARSGSPVHLQPFTASGNAIWLGKQTATYCPTVNGLDCHSFNNQTAFVTSTGANPVALSMSAEVPGGQLVYVTPEGAVMYTTAHSASMESGSVTQAFDYTQGSSFGTVSPVANGATGFLACPATAAQKTTGPWQIFADVKDVKVPSGCADDCYGIDALASQTTGPAAWQYS